MSSARFHLLMELLADFKWKFRGKLLNSCKVTVDELSYLVLSPFQNRYSPTWNLKWRLTNEGKICCLLPVEGRWEAWLSKYLTFSAWEQIIVRIIPDSFSFNQLIVEALTTSPFHISPPCSLGKRDPCCYLRIYSKCQEDKIVLTL